MLAVPFAGRIPRDRDAEEIKVEQASTGEECHHGGPPNMMDSEGKRTSDSPVFLRFNRKKKSIAVDVNGPLMHIGTAVDHLGCRDDLCSLGHRCLRVASVVMAPSDALDDVGFGVRQFVLCVGCGHTKGGRSSQRR